MLLWFAGLEPVLLCRVTHVITELHTFSLGVPGTQQAAVGIVTVLVLITWHGCISSQTRARYLFVT